MSREWGLHCKTCDVSSVCEINHGEHILRSLVKAYPHIKAAQEADDSGYLVVSIMAHDWLADDIFSYLSNHHEHDLELIDEYGQLEPLEEPSQ